VRNPVALRVTFGGQQSGAQLKAVYDQAAEYHNAALTEAREQAKDAKKAGDDFGAAALEFAVGYHRAAIAWLKAAPVK
jgi:hypothetical protein